MKYLHNLFIGLFSLSVLFAQDFSNKENSLKNWHHKDFGSSKIYGIGTEKAYQFLHKKQRKAQSIIVAVIDSGIDIDHKDLKPNLWINPNLGKPGDSDTYVNDLYGWNFIGGLQGDVQQDNIESTRIVRRFKPIFESGDVLKDQSMQAQYPKHYKLYLGGKKNYEENLIKSTENLVKAHHFQKLKKALSLGFDEVSQQLGEQKLSCALVDSVKESSPEVVLVKNTLQENLFKTSPDSVEGKNIQEIKRTIQKDLDDVISHYTKDAKYLYNINFDPRPIVGDHYEDINERFYGNNRVKGPQENDNLHGTHVAGIIGANRESDQVKGIADQVRIMSLRAVPDGDERDKDIANAIRYAVDKGAKIINMSFGKAFSPEKQAVDNALRYAQSKEVLLIHAAGNESKNLDEEKNYPSNEDENGNKLGDLWINVGASSYKNDENLAASFSNYGKERVDLFAPGVEIYSTTPENTYRYLQGTSMAAPVVAGAAALIWSHYPKLNAREVKDLLLSSVHKVNKMVSLPSDAGEEEKKTPIKKISFTNLSKSGGILNLYKAVELAEKKYGKF
ncbi:S8 family serine peptidase [Bacteroidetes bacterium endosymbiont of Geopemphigus sp.]|uniref:S8 family serine peptidase n=1 Tax=Bacteroidetes bacterium endosymbiont of Geopemphigus sp. TaxID=2047937 RepID=UPI000CD2B06A|nr:S8 family serine peptidase [Bacteroidetes bacterium endosymbiont of Geopemphigus sp.]